jgi:hypothetical protein
MLPGLSLALLGALAAAACAHGAPPNQRAISLTAVAEVRATAETVAARFDSVSEMKEEEYAALLEDAKRYRSMIPDAEQAASAPRRKYRLPIHAIKVMDDDGLRAADITPHQVAQWVDKANEVFSDSGIQFDFRAEPNGPDWTEIRDTALNNLQAEEPPVLYAAAEAAKYPDKIVVIFRHGPSRAPAQDAFASRLRSNMVVMPGFSQATTVVGRDSKGRWVTQQNIWMLAHELGHHLGLPHTFPGSAGGATDNQLQAALFILSQGGDVDALDGDYLEDTAPDLGAGYYLNYGWDPCNGKDTVTVSETFRGRKYSWDFTPPRHNIMSYFSCAPMGLSPMQIQVMYRTLDERGIAQADS